MTPEKGIRNDEKKEEVYGLTTLTSVWKCSLI
jgi:hypothetical protein